MKANIIEHVDIFLSKDAVFGYHGWPTVTKGFNNEILVVCSGKRLGHVCPFGKVLLSRSTDQARTWSPPQIIIDTPLDDRDAGITIFNKDMLFVSSFNHWIDYQKSFAQSGYKELMREAYFSNNRITREMELKYYGSTYVISKDNGITWSDVMHAPVTNPHGPTALKDGGLLYMGNYKEKGKASDYDSSITDDYPIMLFYSADAITWEYISTIPHLNEQGNQRLCVEPFVLELDDRLTAFIRVQSGIFATYQTESFDNGKSWTKPVEIIESGAPAHALMHSDGTIVLTYGYREKPYGQRAILSKDNGKTWTKPIILRDDGPSIDLGYPSSVELDDGSILTVYYQQRNIDAQCEIFGTIWRKPDF